MSQFPVVKSGAPHVCSRVGGDADDAVLVASYLAGNREAGELLACPHIKPVRELAYLMLRNRHDADDATQATFEKAFKNLHRYRSMGTFKAWVMRICRNECLDRMRSPVRARMAFDPLDEDKIADRAGNADRDELIAVWVALRTFPLEEREAWFFVVFWGCTSEEAARIVGVPSSTLRSRVARARSKLDHEFRGSPEPLTGEVTGASCGGSPLNALAQPGANAPQPSVSQRASRSRAVA